MHLPSSFPCVWGVWVGGCGVLDAVGGGGGRPTCERDLPILPAPPPPPLHQHCAHSLPARRTHTRISRALACPCWQTLSHTHTHTHTRTHLPHPLVPSRCDLFTRITDTHPVSHVCAPPTAVARPVAPLLAHPAAPPAAPPAACAGGSGTSHVSRPPHAHTCRHTHSAVCARAES
jgi:hypothetical protein